MAGGTLPPEYFRRLYAEHPDPWRISEGFYERRKRDLVMAVLPQHRYGLALEPGCGNGELTVRLAERCERVVAWDGIEPAVLRARKRTASLAGVEVRTGQLPGFWPDERADLVVLSEVGYYLAAADLDRVIDNACRTLVPGGTLVAAHWRREAAAYPLRGDDVHAHLFARPGLGRLGGYADDDMRIDVFVASHDGVASVAQREGVV